MHFIEQTPETGDNNAGGLPSRSTLAFIVIFAAIYALLELGYFMLPNAFLAETLYPNLYTGIGSRIVDLLFPAEHIQAQGHFLASPQARLEIVRGCDGAGVAFLMMAAMLAYPAPLKRRLTGLLLGLALVYVLNLVRIMGLYFVVGYRYDWFLPVHTYFAPSLMILLCSVFFAWWISSRARSRDEPA